MKKIVNKKLIVSGNIFEFYNYKDGLLKGFESKGGRHNICVDRQSKEKNRTDTLNRARKTLRRLINANIGQYGEEFTAKFVTLTFRDHITNLKNANKEFTNFIRRLNYKIFNTKKSNLKYIVVPEFTKKGRIHYHVVFFNIPYIKANLLADIWGHGFIKINKIDNCDNVGAYVSKYMTKDNKKLEGQKSYFSSRGLIKPLELDDPKKIEDIENTISSKYDFCFRSSFTNEHIGEIEYIQYNLNKKYTEKNNT